MAQTFFNYESTCDLTDVPASIYERKTAARPFDTIHALLRSLSLSQSLLNDLRDTAIRKKYDQISVQLMTDGYIHNSLRMLWGKKILEWSRDGETAMKIMIHLNDKYALDGRDPNSYSGIGWIMGKFDKPFNERSIIGNLSKKLK